MVKLVLYPSQLEAGRLSGPETRTLTRDGSLSRHLIRLRYHTPINVIIN